jgi:hypothetical protein
MIKIKIGVILEKRDFSNITLFLFTILCGLSVHTSFAQCDVSLFAGGSGAETDPYQISTAQQLQNLNRCLGDSYQDNYYILNDDIDLTSYLSSGMGYNSGAGWKPIGDGYDNRFYGKFDGNDHKVTGLWINRDTESDIGLFGSIANQAEIKYIGVEIDDSEGGITGSRSVGGLVGSSVGTVINSYATGNVTVSYYNAGGLVGSNSGTVSNSYATGNVTGGSGLVGSNSGTVINSYATGNVTDGSGLVGSNSGTVINSYATGNVTGSSNYYSNVGGLVGSNSGTVSSSYATGYVTGSSNHCTVGGLVGSNSGTVINSYATGNVAGSGNCSGNYYSNVGSLVGINDGTVSSSYGLGIFYPSSDIGITDDISKGISKTIAEMKIQDTYEGWNFESIWEINPANNNGYPTHYWQNPGNAIVVAIPDQIWTGNPITPKSEVSLKGNNLNEGTDFEYTYYNNISRGIAILKIVGKGDYLGQVKIVEFKILTAACGVGFASGTGTETDPYKIMEVKNLDALNNCIGPYYSNKYYELQNDIDLSDYLANTKTGWYPIGGDNGGDDGGFSGEFNGNGHKVLGLWINRPTRGYVGLFGFIAGQVKDIGVEIDDTKGGVRGSSEVGGLAGWNCGTVINSYATGSVTGRYSVGGLVGDNCGTVINSYATGSVQGTGNLVGGLVGRNIGSVSDSYAMGSVTGSGNYIGGLVGHNEVMYNSSGTISNSYATGSVTGNSYIGGLLGENDGGIIINSYATGSVTSSSNYTGGLVGNNTGTVSNSNATGSVTTSSSDYTGGLAGDNSGMVINSYATGNITGSKDNYGKVGGLVGGNSGMVSDSYATGNVTGSNDNYGNDGKVGGLVGGNSGKVSSSYATGNVTAGGSVGGLVGYNYKNGTVSSSNATGNITGGTGGGLVGVNFGTISNSYATGNVARYIGNDSFGGLVGGNIGTVSNSYATGSVQGTGNLVGGLVGSNTGTVSSSYIPRKTDIGIGKTVAEMKKQDTYEGWDFENTWIIVNVSNYEKTLNDGYPILKWQLQNVLSLKGAVVSSIPTQLYIGSAIEPTFTVTLNGITLTENIDYTVSYSDNTNVGTAKITVIGMGNYLGSIEAYFAITAKSVTIIGITAANKEYDGNTTATVTGTAIVSGAIDGDDLIVIDGTILFDDKNVGTDKLVTFSDFSLGGTDAENYVLFEQPASVTADIIAKPVTITGVLAANKEYDGTATATVIGTATVNEKIGNENVTVRSGTASFADNKAGTEKSVTFSDFSLIGTDANNYELTAQPASVTANITAKPVTITGITVANKEYDGNATATVTGIATVNGTIGSDDVAVICTASFADRNAGIGKPVTFNCSLNGNDVDNYELTAQPASVTADIIWSTPILSPQITKGSLLTQTRNGINLAAKTNTIIAVYNPSGKLISQQNYSVGNHSISFGHLPRGVYLIQARFSTGVASNVPTAEILRLTIH